MIDERIDHHLFRRDERPENPRRLAQRRHVDDARRIQPEMRQRSPSLAAQHAKTMCVVDQQPCIMLLA